MPNEKVKILIIDDDPSISEVLKLILEARGYEIETAFTGNEAIEKIENEIYNLAILDIRLPDVEGTKLLKKLRDSSPKMVKIILTGFPQLQNAIEALNEGADAYFVKPVDPEKLLDKIEEKLEEQKYTPEENTAFYIKS